MLQHITQLLAQIENAPRPGDDYPLGPILIVVFTAGLAAFFLVKTRRRVRASQRHSELSARQRVDKNVQTNTVYSQITELMAELADLSRQINGQIDTRVAKLDQLLGQADLTISRLEQLTGRKATADPQNTPSPAAYAQKLAQTLRQESSALARPSDSPSTAHQKESSPARQAGGTSTERSDNSDAPGGTPPGGPVGSRAGNGEEYPSGSSGKTGRVLAGEQPGQSYPEPQAAVTNSPQARKILDLAGKGLTSVEIARQINRPVGEIELILALAGKK